MRRNVIFERARFNRRNQLPGETIEQYITVLYVLIETCEYGKLKEELLRDRIVVGIRDMALSERLQLESDLSLERAKKIVRQKEAVKDHSQELNSTKRDQTAIDAVKKATRIPHRPSGSANSSSKDSGEKQSCKRCGKDHRPTDKCPAKKATCYKCNHKGHFSSQCLSRRSTTATTSEAPRSYDVNIPSGNVRSNHRHLRVIPDSRSPIERPAMTEPTRTIMTR